MGTKVAVEGEGVATVATAMATGADTGKWTAGDIDYSSAYSKLKSGNKKVIWKISCTFSFDGQSSSGATVKTSEPVTLVAKPKKLNKTQNAVLVDGDTITGPMGNKLEIKATGKLTTS